MISNLLMKPNSIFSFQASRFSSVTLATLEKAIESGHTVKVMKDVTRQDIISSKDTKWLSKVLAGHQIAESEHDKTYNSDAIAEAFDEYFRKHFRKLNKD